jgi:hypothetical protein
VSTFSSITIVNWRALSLKRLVHLDDLKRTGRWKRYFATEDDLDAALRAAAADAERWKQLAYRSEKPAGEAAE